MPIMNGRTLQQKIREGQKRHERDILGRVRRANNSGALWTWGLGFTMSRDWRAKSNALDRLIQKGKIEHVAPVQLKSGRWRHGGYRIVGFKLNDVKPKYRGRQWKECDVWGRPPSDKNFRRY